MKISYNWLKQYINTTLSPAEVSAILTNTGLEVEGVEEWQSIKGGLKGIVIGEVKEREKHPNADRLSVCKVDVGNEVKQIVCGASNVAAGQKVVVALPGAMLYPVSGEPFEIKKSQIRGEASEGMICAEDEIGLGTSHDGIMVLPADVKTGSQAADFFNVENDFVFEIGLTPNRADATSHYGVARDLKAVLSLTGDVKMERPDVSAFHNSSAAGPVKVNVHDNNACIRYSGLYIDNLTVKESPVWLQNRLKSVGLRPINNIVDITNYVMLETGQPMHAFDATKIKGAVINVKQLPAGSVFKTLDDVERKLNGTELMICDEKDGMCIAGVFGGVDSGVTATTKAIFLESACFNPVSVRKTARLHGLHTDSSFRFERGTDPEGTVYALKRAALLLKEIAGGSFASSLIDIYNTPVNHVRVNIDIDYINKLVGAVIPVATIKTILQSLEIVIENETATSLALSIPPFKVDVTRPADVVEEIIRIYGYNNIPMPARISMSMPVFKKNDPVQIIERISSYLADSGFREIMNNSLTSEKLGKLNGEDGLVYILNPLSSDLNIMRNTLLFSGLETIVYNMNRKQEQLRLFESGRTYLKKGKGYQETNRIGMWLAGRRYEENWQGIDRPNDIYYMKARIKALLQNCSVNSSMMKVEEMQDPLYEVLLAFVQGKKEIARLGTVSRSVLKKFDLEGPVYFADINVDALASEELPEISVKEPSKFPEVRRDLSMVLDRNVSYAQVEQLAYTTESKLLKNVNLFDVFEGEKIGAGKKSYAMSFLLADEEATLHEKQIEQVMDRLIKNFEQKLGAVIRRQ